VIEPGEYERLLRVVFVERFGTNVAEVLRTNLAGLNSTNQPAPSMAAVPKRSFKQRIAGLFGGGSSGQPKAEKRLSKANLQALGQATPEAMEALLAKDINIPDELLHQLLDTRALWVQTRLIQDGQVTADRLLLVAPSPTAAGARGENRVKLSLN
jgi:hypothetical protein